MAWKGEIMLGMLCIVFSFSLGGIIGPTLFNIGLGATAFGVYHLIRRKK